MWLLWPIANNLYGKGKSEIGRGAHQPVKAFLFNQPANRQQAQGQCCRQGRRLEALQIDPMWNNRHRRCRVGDGIRHIAVTSNHTSRPPRPPIQLGRRYLACIFGVHAKAIGDTQLGSHLHGDRGGAMGKVGMNTGHGTAIQMAQHRRRLLVRIPRR